MRPQRIPQLGYYLIFTDTKETERNYFEGFKNTIPDSLSGKLVISVFDNFKTKDLIEKIEEKAALHPQYCQKWIVFDRDEVTNFDQIIKQAGSQGIHVGWSNPCIESWFHAYFGKMPHCDTSVQCCDQFSAAYKKATRREYDKAEKNIYNYLVRYGDEKNAIEIAKQKLQQHKRENKNAPSKQIPSSTIALLIEEIQAKIPKPNMLDP